MGTGGNTGATEDVRMFYSDWDPWNRGGDTTGSPTRLNPTGPPDSKIDVTGIPYAQYDVYVYVGGASELYGDRGGDFIANGIEKGLSMWNVGIIWTGHWLR